MSHIEQTIEEIESQIRQKQKEVEELKITVNNLCKLLNVPQKYELSGQEEEPPSTKLKGDEYFRRPTATVITSILENRRALKAGPATIDEIYDKMIEGGYVFDKEPKISIGTALGKNPKFTRVGDTDRWGLTEWYPKAKEEKPETNNKEGASPAEPESNPEKPKEIIRRRGRPPKKTEQPTSDINEQK